MVKYRTAAFFVWLMLWLQGQSQSWGQTHVYFRKLSAGFEWGAGREDGPASVKSWNGPFPDEALRFDEELRKAVHEHRATGTHVHLETGTWRTQGISPRGNPGLLHNDDAFFGLSGKGMTNTVLRLEDDAPYDACEGFLYVISNLGAGYTTRFHLTELTIDCNWRGQNTVVKTPCATHPNRCQDTSTPKASAAYKCGFKLGGVAMHCQYAFVDRVEVLNLGANGIRPTLLSGTETFGISITTGNFGQTGTPIVIQNCRVASFSHFNGGYCTAIMAVTRDPSTLHKQRPRGRPGFLAVISTNEVVNLPGGIAYGCAFSEQVRFFKNKADQSRVGFNCDASDPRPNEPVRNIVLDSNVFTNVFQGISIGSPGQADARTIRFRDFYILNNSVHLLGDSPVQCWTGTDDNPPVCGWALSCGIRLHGSTAGVRLSGNRFSAAAKGKWTNAAPGSEPSYVPLRKVHDPGYVQAPGCDCSPAQATYNEDPIVSAPNYASKSPGAFGNPMPVQVNASVPVP